MPRFRSQSERPNNTIRYPLSTIHCFSVRRQKNATYSWASCSTKAVTYFVVRPSSFVVRVPNFQPNLELRHMQFAHQYCASRSCVCHAISSISQKQNVCELIALSSASEQKHLAGCKSTSILLLSAVYKHVERTLICVYCKYYILITNIRIERHNTPGVHFSKVQRPKKYFGLEKLYQMENANFR